MNGMAADKIYRLLIQNIVSVLVGSLLKKLKNAAVGNIWRNLGGIMTINPANAATAVNGVT